MPKSRRKRRYAAPLGGLFIAMAALGAITVIYLCIRLTSAVLDNSSEKQMFENIVRPVVMFNPTPFEKPTDITVENLLLYSMWSTLMGEKRDTYQFGESGELVVPASDLDVAANKLFGPEVKLVHQSFGELDMFYFYDEETSTYSAPVNAQLNVYTPEVISITKNGEFIELNVGYISPGISWQTDFSGGRETPTPEKYMNFIMVSSKDGYQIAKIQDPILPYSLAPPTSEDEEEPENQDALPVMGQPEAEDGEEDGGEAEDGEAEDGETADGETADGETADGETADGETEDSETVDGEEDPEDESAANEDGE